MLFAPEPTADASVSDVVQESEAGSCQPLPNPCAPWNSARKCNQDACQAWAQSLTASGYAHQTVCNMGDMCTPRPNGFDCTCGDELTQCKWNEVCVSDSPNGHATCRPACVPACTEACTSGACLCPTASPPEDVCSLEGLYCDGYDHQCDLNCDGGDQ
jgi:hypothetical protein